jgi:hypothetical protein
MAPKGYSMSVDCGSTGCRILGCLQQAAEAVILGDLKPSMRSKEGRRPG